MPALGYAIELQSITMPFKPGQSGNPHGRPRIGLSLADAVRAGGSAESLAAHAWAMLADVKLKPSERVAVLEFLADRGWGRATQSIDLEVSRGADAPKVDHVELLASLSVEDRTALLEARRQIAAISQRALPARTGTGTRDSSDGDAVEVLPNLATGES